MRPALCHEAVRLGRVLARLAPDEPEVHGLSALMEIQASRLAARTGPSSSELTGNARECELTASRARSAAAKPDE